MFGKEITMMNTILWNVHVFYYVHCDTHIMNLLAKACWNSPLWVNSPGPGWFLSGLVIWSSKQLVLVWWLVSRGLGPPPPAAGRQEMRGNCNLTVVTSMVSSS